MYNARNRVESCGVCGRCASYDIIRLPSVTYAMLIGAAGWDEMFTAADDVSQLCAGDPAAQVSNRFLVEFLYLQCLAGYVR